jgi:hypothetical protein
MTAINAPAVTVTEVVLPGKVEPSGLRLTQRALPPPAAGQALVRVEATAISFAESAMRRGRYYGQPPFPFVPGYDLVGVVEAVGPGVDPSLAGRRVAALTKTGGWATAALLTAADLVEVPSVTRSYRLLNRTGTLVSYSIASKHDTKTAVSACSRRLSNATEQPFLCGWPCPQPSSP